MPVPPEILIMGAAAASGAAALAFAHEARVAARLWSRGRTAIRDAREGQRVKIVGRIAPSRAGATTAPISGRTCFYYVVWVDTREKRSSGWTLLAAEDGCDFVVDDGTGLALVQLERVAVAVPKTEWLASQADRATQARIDRLLERHGKTRPPRGLVSSPELSCKEGVFVEGDAVAVCGVASWEVVPDAPSNAQTSYREPARVLVVRAPPGRKLLASTYRVAQR